MKLHKLDSLAEGTRFKYPECEKIGTVVMHGLSGSRVKYEGDARTVEIEGDDLTGKAGTSFTVPGRPVLVSSGSEVLLWPNGAASTSTPSRVRSTQTRSASPVVTRPALAAPPSSTSITNGKTSASATIANSITQTTSLRNGKSPAGGSGTRKRVKSLARFKRRARTKR